MARQMNKSQRGIVFIIGLLLLIILSTADVWAVSGQNNRRTHVINSTQITSTPTDMPYITPTTDTRSLLDDSLLNDTSLVSNEPCAPPCWNGIIPGETSWSDALNIINNDLRLDGQEIQYAQDGPVVGARWRQNSGNPCCQMVSEDGKTVSYISLSFAPNMTVEQVIETHGEPTYALAVSVMDNQAVVYLFYPEKALIVVAFVDGVKTDLKPESEIIGALYAVPKDMDLTIKTSKLHAWEGYAPFDTYSQDAPADTFEVTPSITLTPIPKSQ